MVFQSQHPPHYNILITLLRSSSPQMDKAVIREKVLPHILGLVGSLRACRAATSNSFGGQQQRVKFLARSVGAACSSLIVSNPDAKLRVDRA